MPRKKLNEASNQYDYLEKKFDVTPAQILKAVEEIGPYKARLETYFQVQAFSKKNQKNSLPRQYI
jgi:hypothetical protein